MLPGRLTVTAVAVVASLTLAACAGIDGTDKGVIRENVIEPGITAIDDARIAACGTEASSFRTALEAYDVLEGGPASDEQALIDRGLLRSESELWDIVDGALVAQDPACGEVPTTVPATEIVTEVVPDAEPPSVDDILEGLTEDDMAVAGGPECTRQLAALVVGVGEYERQVGNRPKSVEQIDTAGMLPEPVGLWTLVDGVERPADGSGCVDLAAANQASLPDDECTVDRTTLEFAVQAYFDEYGELPPSEQALVDTFILREEFDTFDLADGVVVAVPGGPCDG